MIAEILCILAGHKSSLFTSENRLHPDILPLLHPGEVEIFYSLAKLAERYTRIRSATQTFRSVQKPKTDGTARGRGAKPRKQADPSEYMSALGSALAVVLREYETLVVETEEKVLRRDDELVGAGSFVPLSSMRALFSPWDAPFAALDQLVQQLLTPPDASQTPSAKEPRDKPPAGDVPYWPPGVLIDLLLRKAQTGVHQVSMIITQLALAVQRVWRIHLIAFLVHGNLSPVDPLAILPPPTDSSKRTTLAATFSSLVLSQSALPSCVSIATRDSILYIGKAIATLKAQGEAQKQIPRAMTVEHVRMLQSVLPQDGYGFDRVVAEVRTQISDFLWTHVLAEKDVEGAVEFLANYFLLRNGEFAVSLIREIERLKVLRLTRANARSTIIREQDLSLAILRASLGTNAEHDSNLSKIRFVLPTGPFRPLLPALEGGNRSVAGGSGGFADLLLGTPANLTFNLAWPLDLFLVPSDLQTYSNLFSYFASIRRAQQITYECWVGLSNAQRNRRKWTGQDEGGGSGDESDRRNLLRCGWGVLRQLLWFLDTLWGYLMNDVVTRQYTRFRDLLRPKPVSGGGHSSTTTSPSKKREYGRRASTSTHTRPETPSETGRPSRPSSTVTETPTKHPHKQTTTHIDFTTLRTVHSNYLNNLLIGSFLANSTCASYIRGILDACDRFVGQVERWGGDVLPELLFEGSLRGRDDPGKMLKERWNVVREINEEVEGYMVSFYEHLSQTNRSATLLSGPEASIMINATTGMNTMRANATANTTGIRKRPDAEAEGEVRRNIEHLLLRLDFNSAFSQPVSKTMRFVDREGILREGGLV